MTILKGLDFKTILFNDSELELCYSAMKDFSKEFGCFYAAYLFEDKIAKIRLGFGSNPDWQAEFVKNKLMDDCHLCKQGINRAIDAKLSFLLFPWDSVSPQSSREKDVHLYRSDFGIGENGISFVTIKNNQMEALALAPENNNPKFIKFVSQNIQLIKSHLHLFRGAVVNNLTNLEVDNDKHSL
jgi:hypothetical protein